MKHNQEKLAILGGEPIAAHLPVPAWPPVSRKTAKRLFDLYMSRNWSFNRAGEAPALCEEFARLHGAKHAVPMANGTVTLMCALAVHGIGKGDEVIVPAFTWLSSAMAVRYVGAKIVFVDVEPTTLCLDPEKVEQAITERTRGIMAVHFLASMVDMDAITRIAERYNLVVVEDCAQAHGGKWNGRGVGSIGHVGSFSFQHNKIISTGEGGICITNDERIAQRLYRMAYIGYGLGERVLEFKSRPDPDLICHNFRLTEFQALIARDQLAEFEQRISMYSKNMSRLAQLLEPVPGLRIQSPGRRADPQSCYKWAVIFDQEPLADIPIDVILRAIRAEGLPMELSYGWVPSQLLFNLPESDYLLPASCPIAENIASKRTLMLAHQWLGMDEDTIVSISNVLAKLARNYHALQADAA